MPISFTGAHVPEEMIRTGVRWYVADPLSTRSLGEMMLERHLRVDHATMNRWVITYSPQLKAKFHRHKRPVWSRWRLVETDQTGNGQWAYLYCTVDKMEKIELMRMIRKGLMEAGAQGGPIAPLRSTRWPATRLAQEG